jgi:hypothetical protein
MDFSICCLKGAILLRKIKFLFLAICVLLLAFALPASCAADSVTIAFPYAFGGLYLFDYEHSLDENSAINLTGMCMADWSYSNTILKVDSSFTAIDISYKYYPAQSQNGLYCGADLLTIQNVQDVPGHAAGSVYNLVGGGIGIRRIGEYHYTYDYGMIAYYNPDDQGFKLMIRFNMIGFGW